MGLGFFFPGGYVDIIENIQTKKSPQVAKSLKSDLIMEKLAERANEESKYFTLKNVVILWVITKDDEPSSLWSKKFAFLTCFNHFNSCGFITIKVKSREEGC